MDGHGILHPVGLLPPHGAVDPLGGKDGARVLQEQPQDLILPGGEGHGFPIQGDGLGAVVQGDAPGLEEGGLHHAAPQLEVPPQLGLHPGQHLHGVEGLGDVVVRPHVEAQDLVRVLRLGGEEDHRHVGHLPELGHGGDAVQLGHHNVQQHQVDVLLGQDGQGLRPIIGGKDLVPTRGEVNGQGRDDVFLIVTH